MRTVFTSGVVFVVVFMMLPASPTYAQTLDDLTKLQDYTAHRASSADPGGGNFDMRRINAGDTLTLAELQGPGVITHVWFTYLYPSRSALRKLVLRAYFDDIAEPCVEAPLGDFFGLGHSQVYAYASQPLAVGTHAGLNCYWPMPFAGKAKLTLTNQGAQDCQALYFQVDYRKLPAAPPDGLHFHAAYHQAFPCEKGKPYLILETDGGRGHFAGCNLSIEQKDESWWGEGDINIFVDDEVAAAPRGGRPSIAGTGSEDDFSGAWCYSHEFSYPWFGAPLRGRFNKKGTLERCTPDLRGKDLQQWKWPQAWQPGDLWNVYRYHVADPVPFRKSVRVTIEHGWQGNERGDWYSSVAYWYQTGAPARRPALPAVADRIPYYLRPHDHGGGRWEAEDLVDVAKATGGKVEEAGMGFWGDLFSQEYGLQWEAAKTGDKLTLPFDVAAAPRGGRSEPEAQAREKQSELDAQARDKKSEPDAQGREKIRYKIVARLSRIEPGGTFSLAVDDLPATAPVNLYQPPPFPGPVDVVVAEAELAPGPHALTCVALDPDKAAKGKKLMIDKIDITPAGASSQPATATVK